MSKRIPEFSKPQATGITLMAVARLLGSQMQEMNRVSMHTLKARAGGAQCAHRDARQPRGREPRRGQQRPGRTHHRARACQRGARRATAERSPPPTSAPPAFHRKVKHSHPFVRQSTTSGKTRFHLFFRNRHIWLFDCTAQGANCFETIQDCLRARDLMILDAGCVLFEGDVRGRLGKAL